MRFLNDGCAMVFQSSKNCVDFGFASNIVSEGVTPVGRDTIGRQLHVLRQLVMRPKGERDSVQIEKDFSGRTRLCFPTEDALVESHGTRQIGDPERAPTYALLHRALYQSPQDGLPTESRIDRTAT